MSVCGSSIFLSKPVIEMKILTEVEIDGALENLFTIRNFGPDDICSQEKEKVDLFDLVLQGKQSALVSVIAKSTKTI